VVCVGSAIVMTPVIELWAAAVLSKRDETKVTSLVTGRAVVQVQVRVPDLAVVGAIPLVLMPEYTTRISAAAYPMVVSAAVAGSRPDTSQLVHTVHSTSAPRPRGIGGYTMAGPCLAPEHDLDPVRAFAEPYSWSRSPP
jgi:hypothetical protein